jgi:hypothetical protein
MTKTEAWAQFQEEILPSIQEAEQARGGRHDRPLRAECWNNFTDALCKDGQITLKQYESWGHPKGLGS